MLAIAAFIGPFIGITLSLYAISNTEIGVATALMSTVPIILLPVSKFYYKEVITFRSVLGSVIAVLGIFILFVR